MFCYFLAPHCCGPLHSSIEGNIGAVQLARGVSPDGLDRDWSIYFLWPHVRHSRELASLRRIDLSSRGGLGMGLLDVVQVFRESCGVTHGGSREAGFDKQIDLTLPIVLDFLPVVYP